MPIAGPQDLERTHRRADGKPWRRRSWLLLVLLAAGLAAYLLLGSQASIFALNDLIKEREHLLQRQVEAREAALHYRNLLDRLTKDDAFLERLVRERLQLAAPGERVYVIIDKTGKNISEE